jgi:hypothetical protein
MRDLEDRLAVIAAAIDMPVSAFFEAGQKPKTISQACIEAKAIHLLRSMPDDADRQAALAVLQILVALRIKADIPAT